MVKPTWPILNLSRGYWLLFIYSSVVVSDCEFGHIFSFLCIIQQPPCLIFTFLSFLYLQKPPKVTFNFSETYSQHDKILCHKCYILQRIVSGNELLAGGYRCSATLFYSLNLSHHLQPTLSI